MRFPSLAVQDGLGRSLQAVRRSAGPDDARARDTCAASQAVARIATLCLTDTLVGKNSPIQLCRRASMCQAMASADEGAGSGMSLRISLPSSQPQLCE